ncbi:hypothetical protein M422DRAFT_186331, partial [Sphaerobolus stellatus SS14]
KLHVVVDRWTSPQVISWLGIMIHFLTLQHYRLHKGHTGQYLAKMLASCLEGYGVAPKVCS